MTNLAGKIAVFTSAGCGIVRAETLRFAALCAAVRVHAAKPDHKRVGFAEIFVGLRLKIIEELLRYDATLNAVPHHGRTLITQAALGELKTPDVGSDQRRLEHVAYRLADPNASPRTTSSLTVPV